MNKKQFLLDRWPYLLCYASALGLTLLIVQLDLWQSGNALRRGNLLYIGILSSLIVVAWLLHDYHRQSRHLRELASLLAEEDLANCALPEAAVTREQQLAQDALKRQHLRFTEALNVYRQRQELRVHFLNRWVHQMKTPLSVMDLLLQELEETGERESLADDLREELDKLAAGLELMLQSARLDDFTADFSVQQVNLLDVVRQAVNEHKKLFIRSRVYPRVSAPDGDVIAETDSKWLRFVLLQLLMNAVKYSRPAAGEEPSEVEIIVRANPVAQIVVSDRGIGIPPQDIPRIFEPFFTGENGRRFPQATGMGLYLCRQVLDRLGHKVKVTSAVGEGSTFIISFQPGENLHGLLKGPSVSEL